MIISNIAKRYARAFFGIAREDGLYEKYYLELTLFSSIIKESKDLKELLLNPVFGQDEKRAVVDSLLKKTDISNVTANFLRLLVDKRRIGILPDIESCYRKFMDDALKKIRVDVKTAFPLSAELSEKLQKRMEDLTGRKVEMAVSEDASLLGGIVVGVGDTLYDGSIKTQLHNVRNLLGEEI
ncbi:MAG: F0F1 ATP synthase subunit delta [Deltaproteobacteria bacterium]|nr:F0F1 ATP synthase subunit delta [Deltaproteobacteria bacterium]